MNHDIKSLSDQIRNKKISQAEAAKRLHAFMNQQTQKPASLSHHENRDTSKPIQGVQPGEEKQLQEKAASYLKELLSSEIELSADRIEADDLLEKYGLDSIMVMRLTNKLERHFGPLP